MMAIYFLIQTIEGFVIAPLIQKGSVNVAPAWTLFAIVLLHEFGHALACRQVGGKANQIVLWPLGGIAYVKPPPRPGAVHDGRCATAGRPIRRPFRGRVDDASAAERRAQGPGLNGRVWGQTPAFA